MKTIATLFEFCIFCLPSDLCEASFFRYYVHQDETSRQSGTISATKFRPPAQVTGVFLRTAFCGEKSILPTNAMYVVPR
jgi:hypothetical protein